MRSHWFILAVLSLFALSSLGAAPHQDKGTIRGYVYLDSNQNGVFDEGEQGLPGVYVTISYNEYQQTYYTGNGDANPQEGPGLPSPAPGPGSYGPTPLPPGYWKVTLHLPDGYRATTPTELYATVPPSGAATDVNFGIYGSGPIQYSGGTDFAIGGGAGSTLPQTGGVTRPSPLSLLALVIALVGLLALVGTPWCVVQARRVYRRWW